MMHQELTTMPSCGSLRQATMRPVLITLSTANFPSLSKRRRMEGRDEKKGQLSLQGKLFSYDGQAAIRYLSEGASCSPQMP
jgi:hypothetical protein